MIMITNSMGFFYPFPYPQDVDKKTCFFNPSLIILIFCLICLMWSLISLICGLIGLIYGLIGLICILYSLIRSLSCFNSLIGGQESAVTVIGQCHIDDKALVP